MSCHHALKRKDSNVSFFAERPLPSLRGWSQLRHALLPHSWTSVIAGRIFHALHAMLRISVFLLVPPAVFYTQDPQRPLVVDVGCGQGRCLLLLAAQQEARVQQQSHHHHYHHQESLPEIQQDFTEGPPHEVPEVVSSSIDLPLGMNHLCGSTEVNFLGLDVGASIVSQANQWAGERGLSHCLQYVTSDASESLQQLRLYPGPVHAVAVQVSRADGRAWFTMEGIKEEWEQ
eukprot:1144643-Pelagomonas_calceolata.AAC.2